MKSWPRTARRIAQHEAVMGEVREKVHAEISHKADEVTPAECARTEALADSLKRKAVTEVATSKRSWSAAWAWRVGA